MQNTEQKVIEAYLEVLSKEGAAAITLQKLSRQSKVSVSGIQYYFMAEGKPNLAESAAVYVVKIGQDFVAAYMQKAQRRENYNCVKAYVEATFTWLKQYPSHGPFLLYFYHLEASALPAFRAVRAIDMWMVGRARLESLIHEAVGRKIYSAPKDVPLLARQIHSLLAGACLIAGVDMADTKSWSQSQKDVLAAIDLLLG